MTFFKKAWFLPLLLTVFILTVGSIYFLKLTNGEENLSHEGMRSRIEQMYGGSVSNLIQENNQYKALLKREDGLYEVIADVSNGNIVSITLLEQALTQQLPVKSKDEIKAYITKEYEGTLERIVLNSQNERPYYSVDIAKDETLTTLSIDAISGNVTKSTEKQTTADQALLTKKQAITKAKTQLKGEVKYITYEDSSDGGYYLIEIESADDREAVIQVHGISGEILTVTWDDQDDDDDNDKDDD